MIALIGPTDATWQEPARFRARTRWPQEALRVIHPDSLTGPSDLPVEGVAGVVLDGTLQDLVAFYTQQGVPVEVVEAVEAVALAPAEEGGDRVMEAAAPAPVPEGTEKPAKARPGRGE